MSQEIARRLPCVRVSVAPRKTTSGWRYINPSTGNGMGRAAQMFARGVEGAIAIVRDTLKLIFFLRRSL